MFSVAKRSLTLVLVLFLLASCNNKASNNGSDLTKDEEFKNAHELPREVFTDNLRGQAIEFVTDEGNKKGKAYEVRAAEPTENYLFVIHEWWGLNDNIRQEADHYQKEFKNVNVIALDLYDGNVAESREDAAKYMDDAKPERIESIIKGAINYVGKGAKVATVGWCFGGSWSLKSSILLGDQAAGCVIYYGMPETDAKKLASLKADVLGHFAMKDKWITPEVASNFKDVMKALGKNVEIHQYDADHAFANPSSERFDTDAAKKANDRTFSFLKGKLN